MNSDLVVQYAMQSLFHDMHAFIFLKDLENRFIRVSESVAAIHGLRAEDMIGRHSAEFYGEQADLYFADDLEVIRTGEPKLAYIEPLPVDGENRWIEVSKIPVRDDQGTIVGILVVANDVTEKRQAELKLQQSRSLLQTVVDNFPETVAFYDKERRFQFGNPALWRLHKSVGTDHALRIGETIDTIATEIATHLVGEHGTQAVDDFLAAFLAPFESLKSPVVMSVGSRWLERCAYPTPDGGILVFASDVTDKLTAQRELEGSKNLLQTVVDNFAESLALFDGDDKLTFVNPAMRRFHEKAGTAPAIKVGVTVDEMATEIAAIQFGGREDQETREFIDALVLPYRDPNKSTDIQIGDRWIERRIYPTPDGGKLAFASDVTQRRSTEQAVRDSEARYQSLAQTAQVGIFRTTDDGYCTYTNDLWHEMTGIDRDTALGTCWTRVLHPDDRSGVLERWRDHVVEQGTFHAEVRLDRKGGSEAWVLATIAYEEPDGQGNRAFVGTLTDISRLKLIEARLRRTQHELRNSRDHLEQLVDKRTAALRDAQEHLLMQERLAAIGQLTATVSHELRNPLGTIVNSFAALKQRFDLSDGKVERVVGRIDRNLKRCETIIEDLLDYTRVKSLGPEIIDIDSWLAQFIKDYDNPDGVDIRTNLNAACEAKFDRQRMAQVMDNLFDNAVEAMVDMPAADRWIEIETRANADSIVIHCRDSGPGLDADLESRVFEPLVSTKTFGVGLGLPLVRQIVELHGGKVEISNRGDVGAEVTIELPNKMQSTVSDLSPEANDV